MNARPGAGIVAGYFDWFSGYQESVIPAGYEINDASRRAVSVILPPTGAFTSGRVSAPVPETTCLPQFKEAVCA